MDEIDVKLPFTAEVFLQNMITCIGFLLVIAWVFPAFLIACVPLFAVFLLFVMCFRAGIRSLKRSENISRSPLFDHITTSMEGLACIHSYGQSSRFLELLKQKLDANSGAVFMFQSAMRWLAVWLDLLVVMITAIVAFFIVILTGTLSPADAGMALAFAVQMSGIFQFAVRTQTELEAKMTSVERVVYYSEISNLDKKLESDVTTGGENFSVGERQLLCLAKALLMKAKIVLLDEATASLDMSTDKLIQKVIREVFQDATIILIAHRLENVYGLDRVLMMDGGKVVEFDRPDVLLNKTASELRVLVRETAGTDEILVDSEGVGSESSPEIMDKREINDSESVPEIINKDTSPDSESVPEMIEKQESDDEDDSVELLDRPANNSSLEDDDIEVVPKPKQ
ncbi:ABC transporter, ATP-binding protein [Oesophagostomum dentatum]|uniref:ABC transporter, ATP-binding protein n=1 Tax=Oesophagostomum dentatum TaxID=61180 RepID=A0A0B1TF20_OESDE|nr:ABC transporter, ATP-binding protein [Oesophagostomum dentatum]